VGHAAGWVWVHNQCGGSGPVKKGVRGEARVRAKYNIGPPEKSKIPVPGTDRKRIPDGVNEAAKTLTEVKNSKYVSLTPQLVDELAIAKKNKWTFQLFIPPDGEISVPLRKAIARQKGRVGFIP
jgi:hypothetical protein